MIFPFSKYQRRLCHKNPEHTVAITFSPNKNLFVSVAEKHVLIIWTISWYWECNAGFRFHQQFWNGAKYTWDRQKHSNDSFFAQVRAKVFFNELLIDHYLFYCSLVLLLCLTTFCWSFIPGINKYLKYSFYFPVFIG